MFIVLSNENKQQVKEFQGVTIGIDTDTAEYTVTINPHTETWEGSTCEWVYKNLAALELISWKKGYLICFQRLSPDNLAAAALIKMFVCCGCETMQLQFTTNMVNIHQRIKDISTAKKIGVKHPLWDYCERGTTEEKVKILERYLEYGILP